MIQAGFYQIMPEEGFPAIFGELRSVAPCGCTVIVGRTQDTKEVATGGIYCSDKHIPLISRFNLLLYDSLENPTDRLLIDVVDDYLKQAYEEYQPTPPKGPGTRRPK